MTGGEGGGAADTALTSETNPRDNEIIADKKWRRILRLLAGGVSLTRFEAERFGDHALNSTIAEIGAMGVNIAREPIAIEGRFGTIRCKRYWIEPADRDRALALLGVRP